MVSHEGSDKGKAQINLIAPEIKDVGGVSFKDYLNFLSFGSGSCGLILYFVINFATAFAQIIPSYLVAEWTTNDLEEQQNPFYPRLFGGFIVVYVVLAFARCFIIFSIVLSSVSNMH